MSGHDAFRTGAATPTTVTSPGHRAEERNDGTVVSLASSSPDRRPTAEDENEDTAEFNRGSSSFFPWTNKQQDTLQATTDHHHRQQQQQQQAFAADTADASRGAHQGTSRARGNPGGAWLLQVSHGDERSELYEKESGSNTDAGDSERRHSRSGESGSVDAGPTWARGLKVSVNDEGQSDILGEESGTNIAACGDEESGTDIADGDGEKRVTTGGESGQIDGGSRAEEVQLGLPATAMGTIGKSSDTRAGAEEIEGDQLYRGGARIKRASCGIGSGHETSWDFQGVGRRESMLPSSFSAAGSNRKSTAIPEALLDPIRGGRPEEVTSVLESMDEARAMVQLRNPELVALAAEGGNLQVFASILDAMLDRLTAGQVSKVLAEAFHVASIEVESRNATDGPMVAMSMLLQHGSKPNPRDLILLCRSTDSAKLEDMFFDAVASAQNSFIPFLNLSLAFEGAIGEATERDRRMLARLQREMDAVLAETLKSLPQRVSELTGGMAACAALLEPELANKCTTCGGGKGPLAAALSCSHRIVTFATTPLCMNFLLLKFTRGLPGVHDGPRVATIQSPRLDPREESKGQECLTALCPGSTLGGILRAVGKAISGDDDGLYLLTVLPGLHFIATGIVALPNCYYRVPLMMMVLDFIVYVVVVVLYTKYVLLHDEGPLTEAEVAFTCYVVAAFASETKELWRGTTEYLLDRWKVPQMVALQLSLMAFIVRAVDPSNRWGRGLYALGSPLIYWRLLYYVQVLPSQGTTIQVLYGMASELGQFLVVMAVVMLGFALSFFTLCKDVKGQTFRDSLTDVFQAMLGEVGLFDDFVGTRYDIEATVLLVFYLVVMSIMLLNLLIAVLSTAHGRVEELVLIRVARARVYMYYRWVVKHDALPPPLNVVQLVMLLPCRIVDCYFKTDTYPIARRAMGRLMFWLVLGPCAILGGSLLWLVSIPHALAVIWGKNSCSVASRVRRTMLCVLWGTVGMPLALVVSWVTQTTRVLLGGSWYLEASQHPQPAEDTIESMLRAAAGIGMADLRRRRKDPVTESIHCHANEDEEEYPATVEHLRVLLERLETTTRQRIEALESNLDRILDAKLGNLTARLATMRS